MSGALARGRRASVRLLAIAVGLGPGFVLPFAIAWRLDPHQSDGFLFATSFSLVMINVIVVAIENHSMATVGGRLSRTGTGRAAWRNYVRQLVGRGGITIAVVIPLLFMVYSVRDARWMEFWPVVVVVAIAPIAGVFSGVASGVLYAAGRPTLPIWTQGLRSLAPTIVLLAPAHLPPILLATAFSAGEVVRAVVLHVALRSTLHVQSEDDGEPLRHDGLFWQFASSGVSQGNPIVDRLFLAGGQPGNITAYELADKVAFAIYQVFYTGLLLPRSGKWGRVLNASPADGTRLFWRTTLRAMGMTFAAALVAVGVVAAALSAELVADSWVTGLQWSLIALPSVTFSLGQMAAVRFLVALKAERTLLPATVAGFTINVAADFVLFTALGGIGILVATLLTRVLVCAIYLALVLRQQRRILGA